MLSKQQDNQFAIQNIAYSWFFIKVGGFVFID